jgi:arginine/lysine/ornithine decarboxylase
MADAVGADQAFFSTCGSSLSVKAAMLAVAGPGEKLLLSRNAHKSVMAGVIINGTEPVWVHPQFDDERHLAHPPEPDDVRRALAAHPDAKGMLLVTPTDWGTCADIRGVAGVCHAAGKVLIVDEAWGAHLPWHDDLPTWGMNADADLVVTSVHKMGAAVEQSSVFHLQGGRVDASALKQREDLLATTSATSLVYGSLDGWRRHMVERGRELLETAIRRAESVREDVDALGGISLMGRDVVEEGRVFEVDPLVLTMDVRELGITGYQAAEHLRAAYHVDLGAADSCRVTARLTHADTDDTARLLVHAMARLVEDRGELDPAGEVRFPPPGALELEVVMLPREAFFGETQQVPVAQAVGRVAAEMVSPYPPGVPVLAPGELVTADVVDYLVSGVKSGMLIPDAADPQLETLKVVAG